MSGLVGRASAYLLDFGFFPDRVELGPNLQRRRMLWAATAYLLFWLGVFSRRCITLNPVDFKLENLKWTILVATFCISLALFPWLMRWFNRRWKRPSWEHVIWAYSLGFFAEFSTDAVGQLPWKWLPGK
jgi:hypothetical protein